MKIMKQEAQTIWPLHRNLLYRLLSPARSLRILLAAEGRAMRHHLASSLLQDGHEVIEVSDGIRLLELIGSQILQPKFHPPADLIISDIRTPGRTGLEVLAGLRRSDWVTPFILITAFGDEEAHAEARRLGATAIFEKPFEIHDLKTVVLNLATFR